MKHLYQKSSNNNKLLIITRCYTITYGNTIIAKKIIIYLFNRTDGVIPLLFFSKKYLSVTSPDAPMISAAFTIDVSLITRIFFKVVSSQRPQKDFPVKYLI